jgi:hypothetical protein
MICKCCIAEAVRYSYYNHLAQTCAAATQLLLSHLQEAEVTWAKLERCLVDAFMPNLLAALKRQLKKQAGRGKASGISSVAVTGREEGAPGGGEEGGGQGFFCVDVLSWAWQARGCSHQVKGGLSSAG